MLPFFLLWYEYNTLIINHTDCPFALPLDPKFDMYITTQGKMAYSFANWEDGVFIEVHQVASTYGPYRNKNKVFGIYFEGDAQIHITNEKNQKSLFVVGCDLRSNSTSLNNPNFNSPLNYKTVGKYSYNYRGTSYPILFTDDQGASYYYIGVGLIICGCIISSFIIYFREHSVREFLVEHIPEKYVEFLFGKKPEDKEENLPTEIEEENTTAEIKEENTPTAK